MKNSLWRFSDNQGAFTSQTAHQIHTLYFPLCNNYPFMSSISPDLHGDIKTNFNSFLLEPVSRLDLSNLKSSRNFWIYISPEKIWSVTGVSKNLTFAKDDKFSLEAGLLWHKIRRENQKIGLKAEITSFVPASGEPVEIMLVKISNLSTKPIKFIPTCAIPIYARSINNLHDHRQVTSLLNRIRLDRYGVIVTPTLLFDETGHKKNFTSYFVLGIDQTAKGPEYIYPTQEEFTGDNSDLEAPNVIFNNLLPNKKQNTQGREAMGGLRFKPGILKPKESVSYIILMGIIDNQKKIKQIFRKFNTLSKIRYSLQTTKEYWQKKANEISVKTQDNDFDNWFRWVSIQPTLRRIFGCSFLPDFDYGKGGRGWRDLWQDCLPFILTNPKEIRNLLINNFKGVRIDGSNATIIGQKPGKFIADRNNITRVWMDHGVWPLLTTHLYINQSSDLKILLEKTTYFRDFQLCRSQEKDYHWMPEYGTKLKTKDKKIYTGTILEHLLVQNLVQFFNVGPHNHIRLENADWNDGLDMAGKFGESVTFSAMYAHNLNILCELLEKLDEKYIVVFKELAILLDTTGSKKINYSYIQKKHQILNDYFQATKLQISGKTISLTKEKLISDLKKKADWLKQHIQKREWLKCGFFNGYYNNVKQRVEGKINGRIQMTLTGQVFPILSRVATDEQVQIIFKNAKRYLSCPVLGGFRLNTDFKKEQLNLGRAFSFVYGDKENGAFFNHMSIIFAYALYKRGFTKEGYEVLDSIYKMALDTQKSKIYPGLPEYFNAEGRGMYSYLTGSASWFVLTILTQVFGIRAEYGDLIIEPKLTRRQFKNKDALYIKTIFADKPIEISFINPRKKDFGKYSIRKVDFNRKSIGQNLRCSLFRIKRKDFLRFSNSRSNLIEVTLD
jgi:cellobiose phosphorylase